MNICKKNNIKTLFYWDDNFLKIPEEMIVASSYYNDKNNKERLKKILTQVNYIGISSEKLREVSESYNKNVLKLPITIDFSIFKPTKNKKNCLKEKESFKIGYFGNLREKEFEIIFEVFLILEKEFNNIQFEIFGLTSDKCYRIKNVNIIKPIFNYPEGIRKFVSLNWDIALAPLIENDFNECKTDAKYRDYATAKIPGIYSNISVYSQSVKHDITGVLVNNNVNDWYLGIKKLMLNSELRKKIMINAYLDVKEKYNLKKITSEWNNIIEKL